MEKNLLGAHVSISGGFDKAVIRAESIGCTTFQIFLHSNRQWATKSFDKHSAEAFHKTIEASSIKLEDVVVHASYLLNLASSQQETREKSLELLLRNLEQCQELGLTRFVLHPGSSSQGSPDQAIEHIAEGINRAFEKTKNTLTSLALENMAGQGSSRGRTLEELALIREKVDNKAKIGFCFDTCHAFAAGYTFGTPESYHFFWQVWDKIIGIDKILAFHLNDSKKAFDSRVDRHEHIGQGMLGLEAFRLIMNDYRFNQVPKILETPSEGDDLASYEKNIKILRSLLKE